MLGPERRTKGSIDCIKQGIDQQIFSKELISNNLVSKEIDQQARKPFLARNRSASKESISNNLVVTLWIYCENEWYHLIDAQINIQNMILPHVK